MTYALGRHVRHDPRSLNFPAVTMPAPTRSVWYHHFGRVLNQHDVGACTAFALVQWRNTAPTHVKAERLVTAENAFELYHQETLIDDRAGEWPPDDSGGSGVDVCRAARQMGIIGSYTHAFGLDHALGVIGYSPFLLGIDWYESFFTPDAKGLCSIDGDVAGGHEVLVTGYSASSGLWRCLNSWGSGWPGGLLNGRFYLSTPTLAFLLEAQGDITVPSIQ